MKLTRIALIALVLIMLSSSVFALGTSGRVSITSRETTGTGFATIGNSLTSGNLYSWGSTSAVTGNMLLITSLGLTNGSFIKLIADDDALNTGKYINCIGGSLSNTAVFTVGKAGNTAIAGTLTTTGATVLNGGLTMDTNKFTVADTSGNTSIGGTLAVTGNSTLTGALTCTAGVQSSAVAVTATTAGDGTGIIPAGTAYATVTSSGATKIVSLPAPVVGNVIRLYVGANGYELITSAPATISLNGNTPSAAHKSSIAANTLVTATCVSATAWVATSLNAAGTTAAVEAAH